MYHKSLPTTKYFVSKICWDYPQVVVQQSCDILSSITLFHTRCTDRWPPRRMVTGIFFGPAVGAVMAQPGSVNLCNVIFSGSHIGSGLHVDQIWVSKSGIWLGLKNVRELSIWAALLLGQLYTRYAFTFYTFLLLWNCCHWFTATARELLQEVWRLVVYLTNQWFLILISTAWFQILQHGTVYQICTGGLYTS